MKKRNMESDYKKRYFISISTMSLLLMLTMLSACCKKKENICNAEIQTIAEKKPPKETHHTIVINKMKRSIDELDRLGEDYTKVSLANSHNWEMDKNNELLKLIIEVQNRREEKARELKKYLLDHNIKEF